MAAVPAPTQHLQLGNYLADRQIDVEFLRVQLEAFLVDSANLPQSNWFDDVEAEHQAWTYRQAIEDFSQMLKPAEQQSTMSFEEPA